MKKIVLGTILLSMTLFAGEGSELFKKCATCHGLEGEKKALNKSEVIQGWEVERTTEALNGYKDGSYGGVMKGVMKGQVVNLKDEEIKILAEYIRDLKK